jgi:hypothetical protein
VLDARLRIGLQAERPGDRVDDGEQKIWSAEEILSVNIDAAAVGRNDAPGHSVAGRDQPAFAIEMSDP